MSKYVCLRPKNVKMQSIPYNIILLLFVCICSITFVNKLNAFEHPPCTFDCFDYYWESETTDWIADLFPECPACSVKYTFKYRYTDDCPDDIYGPGWNKYDLYIESFSRRTCCGLPDSLIFQRIVFHLLTANNPHPHTALSYYRFFSVACWDSWFDEIDREVKVYGICEPSDCCVFEYLVYNIIENGELTPFLNIHQSITLLDYGTPCYFWVHGCSWNSCDNFPAGAFPELLKISTNNVYDNEVLIYEGSNSITIELNEVKEFSTQINLYTLNGTLVHSHNYHLQNDDVFTIDFNGFDFSNGTYLYVIKVSDEIVRTGKILIVK